MKKLLFIGDINVDIIMSGLESLPVIDHEITCESFELTIGGATPICACAYASLGGNTAFMGIAGKDEYGDFMLREMEGFHIDTGLISRTSRVKTGVTVNLIYENTRTQVTYPGTLTEFGAEHIDYSRLIEFDHIHFSAPYLQTRLLPEITPLLAAAQDRGMTSSLDPQWDPRERWDHLHEWLPLLTYLFVNEAEARSITRTATLEDACGKLAGMSPITLVKTGKDGSIICENDRIQELETKQVVVVDTTGAGDSYAGGFLYAVLEKNMETIEAARFANAVGTRSCLFAGGTSARSTYDDIMRFIGDE